MNSDTLHVYVRYRQLKVNNLVEIMDRIDKMAQLIYRRYEEAIGDQGTGQTFFLRLEEIHTGDSVKFTFGEGWTPKIYSDKQKDIVIQVPKVIGVPLMVAGALLYAANETIAIYDKVLDTEIKTIELELKKRELGKHEIEPKVRTELKRGAADFLDSITYNDQLLEVRLNDVVLKQPADKTTAKAKKSPERKLNKPFEMGA